MHALVTIRLHWVNRARHQHRATLWSLLSEEFHCLVDFCSQLNSLLRLLLETVIQLLFYYSIIMAPKRSKVTAAEGLVFLLDFFFCTNNEP